VSLSLRSTSLSFSLFSPPFVLPPPLRALRRSGRSRTADSGSPAGFRLSARAVLLRLVAGPVTNHDSSARERRGHTTLGSGSGACCPPPRCGPQRSPRARSPGSTSPPPPALSAWRVALPRNYCALQQRTCTTWTRGARLLLVSATLRLAGPFSAFCPPSRRRQTHPRSHVTRDVIECFNWRFGWDSANGISLDFLMTRRPLSGARRVVSISPNFPDLSQGQREKPETLGRSEGIAKGSLPESCGISDFHFQCPPLPRALAARALSAHVEEQRGRSPAPRTNHYSFSRDLWPTHPTS